MSNEAITAQGIAFATPADAPKWKRWFVYSPMARIVIFIAIMAAISAAILFPARMLGWAGHDAPMFARRASEFVLKIVPFLIAYWALVHFIERRRPVELAPRILLPHGFAGIFAGVAFIASTIGVMAAAGSYVVTGVDPNVNWIKPLLLTGLATAIAEEILFRGIIFRISEEGLGTWWALAISALFFGGVHIMNEGATVWSSVAIAIEAGVLLGLAYHLSRSLPLVMGIHMGWNFAQGTVFGVPVSGTEGTGWLVSERPGPEWLSGGVFGAEASVVAVALSLVASAWMIKLALKRGTIVPNPRRARRMMAQAVPQA